MLKLITLIACVGIIGCSGLPADDVIKLNKNCAEMNLIPRQVIDGFGGISAVVCERQVIDPCAGR